MTKKSKPLLVVCTTAYRPLVGGAELAIENITKRIRDDFDVVILTARLLKNSAEYESGDDGEIYRLGVGYRIDKLLLPFLIAWRIRQLKQSRSLVTWGVMVSYASIGAYIAKWLWGTPFVLTLQEGNREWEAGISQWWWRTVIRGADHITVISSFLENVARERGYNGTITLVPNGVDESFLDVKKNSTGEQLRIVSASRLVEKNGIDVLIAGCALLPKNISWHLTLAGDGKDSHNLKLQSKNLGIEDKVTFLGNVPYGDLPRLYQNMDVFVRPARSEGLGTAFLEAMAAGLMTVGTPVGGIVDFLKDGKTGFLIRQDDPQSIADVLTRVAHMTGHERTQIAESARNLVQEKYQWETVATSMKDILKNTLLERDVAKLQFLRDLAQAGEPSRTNRQQADMRVDQKLVTSKIIIATPLYPPDIGGPAAYAEAFYHGFQEHGYDTEAVSFGSFLHLPPIIRHIEYMFELWRKSKGADVIVALDQFSVGFPAALVARARAIPLVFRIGGDFLWERAVEQGAYEGTIREFYESGFYQRHSGLLLKVVQWTLVQASAIIFNTQFQLDLYKKYYSTKCPCFVVHNAIIKNNVLLGGSSAESKKTIVYAGRIIKLKNLRRLIEAFSNPAFHEYTLAMIGDGPEKSNLLEYAKSCGVDDRMSIQTMKSKEELSRAIYESVFCALISYGDVSPNFALECLSLGKAIVLTESTGLKEIMPDLLYVNPSSTEAIRNAMGALLDKKVRHDYEQKALLIPERTWATVVGEFIESIESAIPLV